MLRVRPTFVNFAWRCLTSGVAADTSSNPNQSVSKEALMKLRKLTGYSYVNCRKALVKFGPERISEAEKWLKELAMKEGWAKAAKLSKRATKHGLVSAVTEGNVAAIVEVNCETDFVAKSDLFKALVKEVSLAALASAKSLQTDEFGSKDFRVSVAEPLSLATPRDGKSIQETITRAIEKLGENIILSRVQLISAGSDVVLVGYAHPRDGSNHVSMGRFASVVGLHKERDDSFPTEKLGEQLCQHIIGMRSEKLGSPKQMSRDEGTRAERKSQSASNEDDEQNAYYEDTSVQIDESETELLRQSFMLNPIQTVHEYITDHGTSITGFLRMSVDETCDS